MAWVNVDVDVDLTDFDTEDLVEELQYRGHFVEVEGVDIERIRHLVMCGMEEQAKLEAWQMIKKGLRATA